MKRILVIEDNSLILEDIQDILSLNNFDVITAQNGIIGVQIAKAVIPDLILCDVMMPELDGFGVLIALRQNSLTATIPVVFLTAKTTREDIREGMELGADDYLTKPFTALELLKTISARIEKQEALRQASTAKLDNLRRNIASYLPHELLTPLHGIMGMADLLSNFHDNMTANELIESIAVIQNSSDRLNRLVQNFIIFSELEEKAAGSQTWQDYPQNNDTESVILLAARTCAEKANRTEDLEMNLESVPLRIASKHLNKVIEELVDNAFKFSPVDSAVRLFSTLDQKFLSLYICDRGRGMTTEQIANIGAYMQFDRQYYEQQGNGLGLIISKRIIELYGGELSVESIIGRQTSVCIKFPIGH
ncbi:hybrid sensor histidine kinase/response regulator [Pseudanabaena sp. FACHB-1998]|uniref:hybrid sensor histidine kinase/response regulator n=1 Tax=Pseudanabaena sp. FACHB-1998 TaxID=2692858 RepID=UPI0016812C9F|nr:hybrid sensor histidine kinase/response regulator [Pseudanabaena sp. FACHB-1998]MBD2175994.1 hybrid sensor histidine kinase/response regulator [Pseudanabaena sp. FACHB-1998]